MKSPNVLLEKMGETIREILAGGLEKLPPDMVKKIAVLVNDHGAHLRFVWDAPIMTCELVVPKTSDGTQTIEIFKLTPTVSVGSNAVN